MSAGIFSFDLKPHCSKVKLDVLGVFWLRRQKSFPDKNQKSDFSGFDFVKENEGY